MNSVRLDPEGFLIHCPRLGGTVPFNYCMKPAQEIPCSNIFDCWRETFDVFGYLKQCLPSDIFDKIQKQIPIDRLSMILSLINKVKASEE